MKTPIRLKVDDLLVDRASNKFYRVIRINKPMKGEPESMARVLLENDYSTQLAAYLWDVKLGTWNLRSNEDVIELLSNRLREDLIENYSEDL